MSHIWDALKALLKEALWQIYLILCISVSLYESQPFMWRKWLNGVKMASRGTHRRGAVSLSCAPGDKNVRLLNQHNALSVRNGGDILKHCMACKTEEVNTFVNAAAQIECDRIYRHSQHSPNLWTTWQECCEIFRILLRILSDNYCIKVSALIFFYPLQSSV